ncbi:MAG: hypothetical protein ACRCX2_04465 [Paraclostridium sp.]
MMNVIKIDNKDYVVKYTFGSHIKMQDANFDMSQFEVNGLPNFSMIRDLLYYGLDKFHKASIEECEELIDVFIEEGGTLQDLLGKLVDAYSKSLGVSEKDIKKATKKK